MNAKEEDLSSRTHGKRDISTKQPSTGKSLLGLLWYNARYTYCSLRGGNLEEDLPSWEATTQLLNLVTKPKTIKMLLELMFKITTEWFDMTRFPSRDCGSWDKAIRMQDLMIALQQRYVNGTREGRHRARTSVIQESDSKRSRSPTTRREQEIVMGNFLDLFVRATFAPEGSAHDKHLKAWIENMQKTGSLELFFNATTASNVNEGTRILQRERMRNGSQLNFAAVWDAVRTGYLMLCGTGVENVDAALDFLNL